MNQRLPKILKFQNWHGYSETEPLLMKFMCNEPTQKSRLIGSLS